jgi:hypothetical protein
VVGVRERETSNSLPREVSGGAGVVASNISVDERPARLGLVQVNWVGERGRSSEGDFHGSKERKRNRGKEKKKGKVVTGRGKEEREERKERK